MCSTDIDDCEYDPCQNHGTCIDKINGFSCLCAPGYTDKECSTGKLSAFKIVTFRLSKHKAVDRCPQFARSRTFFSSALSPFSDYRFVIRHLEFCRVLVLSRRDPVEIFLNIFGKSFQFWTTEKIKNIEPAL